MSQQFLRLNFSFVIICVLGMSICFFLLGDYITINRDSWATKSDNGPFVNDPDLKVEKILEGLKLPTSMTFLGPDDILVLEKDDGTVRRILNGHLLKEPLLDVKVANKSERGMLGIATSKSDNTNVTRVFLYYTEAKTRDGDDASEENQPLGNRLYRYDLQDGQLTNPKLLLNLPATPNRHNGGPLLIGPDNNVYLLIGDIGQETKTQNFENGPDSNGTGV